MRTIDQLAREYPDKTGAEYLEIQKQDKINDEKEFERINAKNLAIVKDINENGAYYKGTFGNDQRFYYKLHSADLDSNGVIWVEADAIIVFFGDEPRSPMRKGEINIKKEVKDYQRYDTYSVEMYERISEAEWNELNEYLEAVKKFWENK